MKIKPGTGAMLLFTILISVSGFCLRTAFNEIGGAAALIGVSVLAAAVFALLSLQLPRSIRFEQVLRRSPADLILSVLAAILLTAGCVLNASENAGAEQYISLLGVVGAVGMLVAACLRFSEKKHAVWSYLPLILYYVMKLFLDFRRWTVDPDVLDYCFMLFAAICFMLASYHEGSFCFDKGNRRILAFFAMCGVFFGMMSISDATAISALQYGGSVLWMLVCVTQTVRK